MEENGTSGTPAEEEKVPPAEAPPPAPEPPAPAEEPQAEEVTAPPPAAAAAPEPSPGAEAAPEPADVAPAEATLAVASAPAEGVLTPVPEVLPPSPGSASKKKKPTMKDTPPTGTAEGGESAVSLPVKAPLDLKHERLTGVVAKYTQNNGWGVLKSHMFEGELMFRADRVMPEFQGHPLNEGDNVEFDVQADDHGRPHAVAMKPVLGRRPTDCLGQRHRGYVRRFAERWGFLNAAAFDGDLFVHRDNLLPVPDQVGDGQPPLRAGQAVEFDVALDDRGRAVAKQITTRALPGLRPCDWISHRLRGYIRSFQGAWGFINSDRFAGDLFVHRDSLLAQCQNAQLAVGTIVEFDVERDHHRKGAKNRLVARHVAVLSAGEAVSAQPPAYGSLPPPSHPMPGAPLPPQAPIHMDPAVAAAYGGSLPPQPLHNPYGAMNPQAPSFAPSQPMYYAQPAPPAVGLTPEQHQQLAAYGATQYPYAHQQYPLQSQLMPPQQPLPPQYGQSPYSTMPQYGQQPYAPQYGIPPPQPGQPQGMLPPVVPQQPQQQQQQQPVQQLATAGTAPAPLVQPQAHPQMMPPGAGVAPGPSPEEQQRAMQAAQAAQVAAMQQARPQAPQPQPQAPGQAEGVAGAAAAPLAPAGAGAGAGAVPVSGEGTSQGLLHITMHDWEPDQPGQLWVTKGTLVRVSYRAAHGWVYAGTVQPGNESGEPASEGWVPQAVVKRVSLCRVSLDWPDEGAGTLGVSRGEIVAVSKEAERGWVYGERIGPRQPDRPSDGWLPKKVLDYLQS